MRPRVRSFVWTYMPGSVKVRRWHVAFEDSCGCCQEEDFATWAAAVHFARHIACGGSRWEFVA